MTDEPQKICEAFNIHFATIGEKIGKKTLNPMILPSSHSLIHQLHSFFFWPRLKRFTCLLAV